MTSVKRWFAVAAILLLAVATAVAGPAVPGSRPQIHFPDQSHLFPPVIEGDTAAHDFVIENYGTAPLEIIRVRTD
ncbi:MAG: hypothetical protein ABIL58_20825 [Pseudomonadota bacterium]